MSDIQAEPQVIETQTPPPVDPAPVEPQEPKVDHSWVPKRISEITAARRAAEARAEQAEAELARLRASAPTPAVDGDQPAAHAQPNQSVEQLARAYAERMVREQREQETLTSRIASINEAGAKEFGEDFDKSVANLNMAGVGGPDFLKVLTSIDGAEKVVTWLGKSENIDKAMRIASLDPVQMGIEMVKLSGKAAKALSKQVSKAPPPVQTIEGGGGGAGDSTEPDPSDTKKWVEWRNKNRKSRR